MTEAAAILQVEVHVNFRNERTIDWCKKEGIHVTAYAPLSSPQTMSSQKKSVPNLLEVSHVCTSCDLCVILSFWCPGGIAEPWVAQMFCNWLEHITAT